PQRGDEFQPRPRRDRPGDLPDLQSPGGHARAGHGRRLAAAGFLPLSLLAWGASFRHCLISAGRVLGSVVNVFTNARLFALSLVLASLLAGCGGKSDNKAGFKDVVEVGGKDKVTAVIANSELVVGPNRFVLGLLDETGVPIVDAK